MTQAHNALCLSQTTNTTLDNKIKQVLRLVACDDVIICFKDKSYLVYKHDKDSYRNDRLFVENCQDNLPFCPVDLDSLDLTREDW